MLFPQVNSNACCNATSAASSLIRMAKKRKMQEWQVEDALRLKAIWESLKPTTQEKFAADYELGSQGALWQYINGVIPLNLEATIKFAQGLNIKVRDISPTYAEFLSRLPRAEEPPLPPKTIAEKVAADWALLAEPIRTEWREVIAAAAEQTRKLGPVADGAKVASKIRPAPAIQLPERLDRPKVITTSAKQLRADKKRPKKKPGAKKV